MPRIAPRAAIHVGTSGWIYDGWRGPFFPSDLPKTQWLEYYGGQFGTTEINSSFYRTPSPEAVRNWHDSTPDDFLFAWKASKFITHWKRLGASSANSLELMETRLAALKAKLGPVLFQLPARFKADRPRLGSFIKLLKKKRRYAFEFRDASWYDDSILDLLRDEGIALCISDHRDAPSPWIATAEHVYVRAHGPTGQYRGRYSTAKLTEWAKQLRRWRRGGRSVFCYFDNDQKSAAPHDAGKLIDMLERRGKAKGRSARSRPREPAA